MSTEDWKSIAIKTVVGIAAMATLGFAFYSLSQEDQDESAKILIKKRIGKVNMETKGNAEVIELKQLLKIMELVKELSQETMNAFYAKRELDAESFKEMRFKLFTEQNH